MKPIGDLRKINEHGFNPFAGRHPAVVAQMGDEITGWAAAGPYGNALVIGTSGIFDVRASRLEASKRG